MRDWDEELSSMLFEWTAGARLATLPLIDAVHYVNTGRHLPEIKRDYPDELASPGLVRAVRRRIQETRATLQEGHPTGAVRIY
ncbi:hypothetical protein LCGC14_1796690, partial [marine sediment metagenome]